MPVRFGNNENQRSHTFRYTLEAGLDSIAVQQAIERDLNLIPLIDGLNKGKLELKVRLFTTTLSDFWMGASMSDGSLLPDEHPLRPLRPDERELLRALLSGVWSAQEIHKRLTEVKVRQMSDGGMGSVLFINSASEKRRFVREVATADYLDEDGIPVDITVNLDQDGELFEVDFWKVDFSPLLRYPRPKDLKIRKVTPHSIQTAVTS